MLELYTFLSKGAATVSLRKLLLLVQTNKRTLLRIHAARQKIPLPAARFVMLAKHHGTPLLSGDVFQWARFRNENLNKEGSFIQGPRKDQE